MRRPGTAAAILIAIVLAGLLAARSCRPRAEGAAVEVVRTGPLEVQTTYEGAIQSRHTAQIMSRLSRATVVWIVPDGSPVTNGAPVVRFSTTEIERELVKLERDGAEAQSEYDSLE